MKLLLLFVVVVLVDGAASLKDLSGKMFSFPVQNDKAHVRLITSKQEFSAVTVCHRSFTDLKRPHVLFSLATPSFSNGFLIFWKDEDEFDSFVLDQVVRFAGFEYKLNMWHSICTTWDAKSGLMQLWFNGIPSGRKFTTNRNMTGNFSVIVGQEQDSFGGDFSAKQAFTGMMSDVHMWDYVLSACEIHNYFNELNFTPGNVLNWRAMEFQMVDKVLLEEKISQCH